MSTSPPIQYQTSTPDLAGIGATTFTAAPPATTTCTTTFVESKTTPAAAGAVLVGESTFANHLCNKFAIFFFIISIIVLVLLLYIASSRNDWFNGLNKFSFAALPIVLGIVLVIVVLMMAGSAYFSYSSATDENARNQILFSFVASMILLIILFIVFYVEKNFSLAFYLSLVMIFVAFMQMALNFQQSARSGWCTFPYLLFFIIISVGFYNIWQSNPAPV